MCRITKQIKYIYRNNFSYNTIRHIIILFCVEQKENFIKENKLYLIVMHQLALLILNERIINYCGFLYYE